MRTEALWHKRYVPSCRRAKGLGLAVLSAAGTFHTSDTVVVNNGTTDLFVNAAAEKSHVRRRVRDHDNPRAGKSRAVCDGPTRARRTSFSRWRRRRGI